MVYHVSDLMLDINTARLSPTFPTYRMRSAMTGAAGEENVTEDDGATAAAAAAASSELSGTVSSLAAGLVRVAAASGESVTSEGNAGTDLSRATTAVAPEVVIFNLFDCMSVIINARVILSRTLASSGCCSSVAMFCSNVFSRKSTICLPP